MIRFLTLSALTIIYLQADFISKYEHGQKLYENPRGIACGSCHGKSGEGMTLAEIYKNGADHTIKAPKITDTSVEALQRALTRGRSVMPVYRLTDEEIEAIYLFLNTQEPSP